MTDAAQGRGLRPLSAVRTVCPVVAMVAVTGACALSQESAGRAYVRPKSLIKRRERCNKREKS